MNWLGNLIQKNIEESDTVLDLGCGIMQATLDVIPSYPKTRLKCKRLFGVDIHKPYLDYLNDLGIETLEWDLRKVPLPFKDKSFDIVLMTDLLEHLDHIEYANKLINESKRIARKKVIILTPIKFINNIKAINNPYPYKQFKEKNEFQKHNLLISKNYLEKNDFKVYKKKNNYFAIIKLVNKILHVWDVAGVASLMCKYQNKLGYNSKLYSSLTFDKYKHYKSYKNEIIETYKPKIYSINNKYLKIIKKYKIYFSIKKIINQLNFTLQLKKIINEFKPNIIHFHSLIYIPIIFKVLRYRLLIEFHGTDIRLKYNDGTFNLHRKNPKWIFRIYQLLKIPIFVSTPDLLRDVPNYNKPKKMNRLISNPVDIDIFNKSKHKPISELALYSLNIYDINYLDFAISRAKSRNFKIVIHDRAKGIFLEHKEFADYLSSFECYIDRLNIGSLSKTALEALSMGLKVINWNNDLITELSSEHYPFNVAIKTLEIYNKMFVGEL